MSYLYKSTKRKRKNLKMHWANIENRPLCGGGNGAKKVLAWQLDTIGPLTCGKCRIIMVKKGLGDEIGQAIIGRSG